MTPERNNTPLIIGAVVAALFAVITTVIAVVLTAGDSRNRSESETTSATRSTGAVGPRTSAPAAPPAAEGQLPPVTASAGRGADCQYLQVTHPAKNVQPPRSGPAPRDPAQVNVAMRTNRGTIGLSLDNTKSPCTVNSFTSLAGQGYFDNTDCHRLTTAPTLSVLQCGSPAANGAGGPGYQFADEYPVDQYPFGAGTQPPVRYPRGTLAMANAGPNTNGSQFFLVYRDSQLPPAYTVFGSIDDAGLAVLDRIAAAGVEPGGRGPDDGSPTTPVTITSVRLG